jgi:hypothetical protein
MITAAQSARAGALAAATLRGIASADAAPGAHP